MQETSLVTGATGFVGAHVARLLAAEGHQVRALCRPGSTRELLSDTPVDWRVGDLRDDRSIREALQGCTALFHVAADYRLWSARPADLYETNVEGARSILRAAREAGVRRAVYTSTVGALGLPAGGGEGNEETPSSLEKMVGDYKRSKFLAEEVAREAAGSGMEVVIVNPSTPIGSGDIKPTPTGRMITDFINGAIPAYLDTGLNLVPVKDVALGHLLAFRKGGNGQRYILGGRNMTLHQILELIAEVTGLPAPRIRIPYPLAYAVAAASTAASRWTHKSPLIALDSVKMAHSYMFFDSSRAVRELGLPQSPVSIAVREAVQWFVSHGYISNRPRASVVRRHLGLQSV